MTSVRSALSEGQNPATHHPNKPGLFRLALIASIDRFVSFIGAGPGKQRGKQ